MSTIAASTKIYWTLNEANYRVLVRTKTGFLQVKSVENGVTATEPPAHPWLPSTNKLTPFDSFEAWFASLPMMGNVSVSPHKTSLNHKMEPLKGTDVEKMYTLTSRFHISEPKYHYKQRASLIVGDGVKNIYCEKEYIEGSDHDYNYYIRVEGDEMRYTSFADIGDCLDKNGRPKITVAYRKKMIPVAEMF